jgi:hypothetical protein
VLSQHSSNQSSYNPVVKQQDFNQKNQAEEVRYNQNSYLERQMEEQKLRELEAAARHIDTQNFAPPADAQHIMHSGRKMVSCTNTVCQQSIPNRLIGFRWSATCKKSGRFSARKSPIYKHRIFSCTATSVKLSTEPY